MHTRVRHVVLTTMLALSVGPTLAAQRRELPLGPPGLAETRTVQHIAPGVTYTRIARGEASPDDYFTVFIFKASVEEALDLAQQLEFDGYQPRIEMISERAFDDPVHGPLGWRVTVGRFDSVELANAQRDALAADGYTLLRVAYTGEDGQRTTGPWVVHVLDLNPARFRGEVMPVLGTGIVPGNALLTSIAAETGALAAINGGYFVIGTADGSPGDLAGISMLEGNLVSEAVRRRTSLVLPTPGGRRADIEALSTRVSVSAADGARRTIDGLNRNPGLIRGCGGTGDTPTDEPKHDFTCTDSGELILFRPIFGAQTEPGAGVEVALAPNGAVIDVRTARGGPIPVGGAVLAGTGDAAAWLQAHALPGTVVSIRTQVLNARGWPLALGAHAAIVNGGPRLVRNGVVDITAAAEGFHWSENPEFYYRFGGRRNPRTLAGITAKGHLLLVAVDGRSPVYSVGASFKESARIMQSLGAIEAVNLDGGGSTTLTIGTEIVNRPSDATGERPIADAIVILR